MNDTSVSNGFIVLTAVNGNTGVADSETYKLISVRETQGGAEVFLAGDAEGRQFEFSVREVMRPEDGLPHSAPRPCPNEQRCDHEALDHNVNGTCAVDACECRPAAEVPVPSAETEAE